MTSTGWQASVTDDLAGSAVERAVAVGERLRDESGADPGLEGSAGMAILFGQLDRAIPGAGWDVAAHRALAAAVRGVERTGSRTPGLFGGLGGVAFAAWSLSRDGSRYGSLLATLHTRIDVAATELSRRLSNSPTNQPFEAFDAVNGLAGIAGYLLNRGAPALDGLVALCGSGPARPNWFTPPEALDPETPIARQYAVGVYNCGLAHGIPGPLALLSIALRAGHAIPGQAEAVERVASWLVAQRVDDEWGANWPSCVAPGETARYPAHSAWCYGSPGVARTLWLAGTALADDKLRDLAVEAMSAVYRRPWQARQIGYSPGLCHGVAGLLQITLRFAHDTADPMFTAAAVELTERLLEMYRPDVCTGYFSTGLDGSVHEHGGLLDGAAGAALALLAAGTDTEPVWDRLLLLA